MLGEEYLADGAKQVKHLIALFQNVTVFYS